MLIYWAPLVAVLLWRAYWKHREAEVSARVEDGCVVLATASRTRRHSRWPVLMAALPGVLSLVLLVGAVAGASGASSSTPSLQSTPTSHTTPPTGHR